MRPAEVMSQLVRIAGDAGALIAFTERGGTPAMVSTCSRLGDICGRLERWLKLRVAPPLALKECIERLPAIVEVIASARDACGTLHDQGELERVAELADVFASLDVALDHLDREVPKAN